VGGFQRARSPEQIAQRRAAVLAAAEQMLAELPVSEITLNELSRRVGLAKSNVLRYFESREAVLLALLARESQTVLDELAAELVLTSGAEASVADRCERLAATIAAALARHPQLCDLNSNSAAVLERNISVETAAAFKRSAIDTTGRAGAGGGVPVRRHRDHVLRCAVEPRQPAARGRGGLRDPSRADGHARGVRLHPARDVGDDACRSARSSTSLTAAVISRACCAPETPRRRPTTDRVWTPPRGDESIA
jgi:AcrR family transcriptional regulator